MTASAPRHDEPGKKFVLCGVQKVRRRKKRLTFLSNVVAYPCRHSPTEYRHMSNHFGRPIAYKPEYCELAHNYCLLGATNDELAGFFDVTPRHDRQLDRQHPRIRRRRVREGRDLADARVARSPVRPRRGLQPQGRAQDAASRRGADDHQRRALSARHPGLHLLAAQPPPPELAREARPLGGSHAATMPALLEAAGEGVRNGRR